MESSSLVTRADERGKFLSLVYIQWTENMTLPFSFFFPYYSLLHTLLPSTTYFSSLFKKRQPGRSSDDIICCLNL